MTLFNFIKQLFPQPSASTRNQGAGVVRALARLAEKREANELIPTPTKVTRQMRRALLKLKAKGQPQRDQKTGVFSYRRST